jgi:hypothetical protein
MNEEPVIARAAKRIEAISSRRIQLFKFCRDSLFHDRIYPERSEGSRRSGIEFCTEILRLKPQDRFCRETRQNLFDSEPFCLGIASARGILLLNLLCRLAMTINLRGTKRSPRGSILLEGVLSLFFIVLPLSGLQLELIRSAQYQVMFHHLSFLFVRSVALGSEQRIAFNRAIEVVTTGLGQGERLRIQRRSETFLEEGPRGLVGRVRYRYPGLLVPFFHSRPQTTKRCLFSW